MIDELCVYKSVVTVIAQHYIIPHRIQQGHFSQVDDVIGIAVNLIAIVVEVIERGIKERAEGDAQNAVDYGSSCVGVPANGNHGTIPCEERGTIGTCGRGQGATPTPQVVGIVVVEVVVVVVAGVVKVVLVVVTMMTVASVAVVAIVSVVVVAIVSVAVVAIAAMAVVAIAAVAVVAIAAMVASIGLAIGGDITVASIGLAAVALAIAHRCSGGAVGLGVISTLVSSDIHAGIITLTSHCACAATLVAATAGPDSAAGT